MKRRNFFYSSSVSGLLLAMLLLPACILAAELEQHHDGVLGTSFDLSIHGPDTERMDSAVALVLAEIARLEQALSTYRDDSELMELNRARSSQQASQDLLNVVDYCNQWFTRSEGRFSCRMGRVLALWDEAEQDQLMPQRPAIRRVARDVNLAEITIDSNASSIALEDPIELEPSGLAKGYVIDRAMAVLRRELPDATAIKVDIGGDAFYWGSPPDKGGWQVAVADPIETADNQRFITSLEVESMAVAASGHTSRTRTIGRREFSHILAPRDGWPVSSGTASVVIAPDAVTADAVATALAVQPLAQAIDWVNTLAQVEALVIDAEGRQLSSQNWQAYEAETSGASPDPAFSFSLDYTLPEFDVASYYRPYVAIWITDPDQQALKNLLILGETERWARENTRWWRRVGRRNPELLDGVARATRGPGEYNLAWDGMDDFGDPVPPGDYLLHLEASRESGGSTYRTIGFSLGSGGHSVDLEPDGELGAIRLRIQ